MNLSFVYQNLNIISFRLQIYEFNFKNQQNICKIAIYHKIMQSNAVIIYFSYFCKMTDPISFSSLPMIWDMAISPATAARLSRLQTLINWLLRVLDSTRAMPGQESVHHHVVH